MPSPPALRVRSRRLVAAVCVLGAGLALAAWRARGAGGDADHPLVLVVSGDTAGWIVPCGCTSNQSGGLLRRGSRRPPRPPSRPLRRIGVRRSPRGGGGAS